MKVCDSFTYNHYARYNNNNNLFEKIEWLVLQIVTKLIKADKMNTGTLEKSNKILQIQTCKNFT